MVAAFAAGLKVVLELAPVDELFAPGALHPEVIWGVAVAMEDVHSELSSGRSSAEGRCFGGRRS